MQKCNSTNTLTFNLILIFRKWLRWFGVYRLNCIVWMHKYTSSLKEQPLWLPKIRQISTYSTQVSLGNTSIQMQKHQSIYLLLPQLLYEYPRFKVQHGRILEFQYYCTFFCITSSKMHNGFHHHHHQATSKVFFFTEYLLAPKLFFKWG